MKIIGKVPPTLLYLLISLSTFTETVYSASLPQISRSLNTSGAIAQLSTTAYYFGFAIGILTLGRISDIIGRRPVALFGIMFYSISSCLISYAPNIESFIILRFFQAYGGSIGSVIGQAMTRDSYRGWELSYMYASIASVMAVVPTLGSAIGGYFTEYMDWQFVFRFLTILSIILFCIYYKFLPETNPFIGVGKKNDFFAILKITLKDKVFLSYTFIIGCFNGIAFGFYIQAPFIFIERLQMQPSDYGKLFFLLSFSTFCSSILVRLMLKKMFSSDRIRFIGFVFSIIGCVLLMISSYLVGNSDNIMISSIFIFVPMMIHFAGHSFVVPMILRDALEGYRKVTGSAGSIFGFMYYTITAFMCLLISATHSCYINNYTYLYAVLLVTAISLYLFTLKLLRSNKILYNTAQIKYKNIV